MRFILPIFAVALVACSGGGATPSLQSAALEGMIYELDPRGNQLHHVHANQNP